MSKNMLRLLTFGLLITLMSAVALPSASAAKPPFKGKDNPFANIPVAGTVAGGGTVEGLFTINRFDVVKDGAGNNQMRAVGTFTGKVGDRKVKDEPVAWPATLQTGSASAASDTIGAMQAQECPILNLVLGPLDLNLLGLEVHLNQVLLDIIAVAGPGNLLGNLLCAIAGLLDGSDVLGQLTQIVNLLNAINDLFG